MIKTREATIYTTSRGRRYLDKKAALIDEYHIIKERAILSLELLSYNMEQSVASLQRRERNQQSSLTDPQSSLIDRLNELAIIAAEIRKERENEE